MCLILLSKCVYCSNASRKETYSLLFVASFDRTTATRHQWSQMYGARSMLKWKSVTSRVSVTFSVCVLPLESVYVLVVVYVYLDEPEFQRNDESRSPLTYLGVMAVDVDILSRFFVQIRHEIEPQLISITIDQWIEWNVSFAGSFNLGLWCFGIGWYIILEQNRPVGYEGNIEIIRWFIVQGRCGGKDAILIAIFRG